MSADEHPPRAALWVSIVALLFAAVALAFSIRTTFFHPARLKVGQVEADQVWAKRFFVRAPDRKQNLAMLGYLPTSGVVSLILTGSEKSAIMLNSDSVGVSHMDMRDSNGVPRISLTSGDEMGKISVLDRAGTARASMMYRQSNPAAFMVYDSDGNIRWFGTDEEALDRKLKAKNP